MLDLLMQAHQAATTIDRQDLLMGVMDDDDRLVRRVMERSEDHSLLLEDAFFIPLIGLAAEHGSRSVWKALNEWGYSFSTQVRHPEQELWRDAEMDLCGWICSFGSTDRLEDLIMHGIIHPFDRQTGTKHLTAGEVGMLNGDDDRFSYWLGKWQTHAEAVKRDKPYAIYQISAVASTLLGMQLWAGQDPTAERLPSYPDTWCSAQDLEGRIDRFNRAFLAVHYPAQHLDPQALWEAFVENPPVAKQPAVLLALSRYLASRAPAPLANPRILTQAMENGKYTMAAELINMGASTDILVHGRLLPLRILQLLYKDTDPLVGQVWEAWIKQAKANSHWLLPTLPLEIKVSGAKAIHWLVNDKGAKRLMEAVTLSCQSGPSRQPEGARPRARL